MTSASELFYQRRSRLGRAATADLEIDPSSSHGNLHLHYTRRYPHHQSHSRHDRLTSHSDRASVWLDQGTSQFEPSDSTGTETLSSTTGPSLTGNDRLPGTVLLARARLLERLRGVSLSGNRRSGNLGVVDAGHWGTDISPGWSARGSPFTQSTHQTRRLQFVQESYKKKPPGLTPNDLDCLEVEVFSGLERGTEEKISRESWDCSICLESFKEGDKLICLPCEHRFHSACLDPWIRTCGDCPYCRRDIVVSNQKSQINK